MIDKLKEAISHSENIVFFTGAGMSTESGIPDFRSENGLYKNTYRAEEMLSHSFFLYNPKEFYEFYREKMIYPDAKPNVSHLYMARLQETKNVTIVTQNIDGLHTAAGSKKVFELHGSVYRNYCMKCGKKYDLSVITETEGIPHCSCGGTIRPDVVLYEEGLNEDTIYGAIDAIEKADLLVVCGTSLNVYPAAGFLGYFRGKHLAIINRDATAKDNDCDIVIHDSLGSVFSKL